MHAVPPGSSESLHVTPIQLNKFNYLSVLQAFLDLVSGQSCVVIFCQVHAQVRALLVADNFDGVFEGWEYKAFSVGKGRCTFLSETCMKGSLRSRRPIFTMPYTSSSIEAMVLAPLIEDDALLHLEPVAVDCGHNCLSNSIPIMVCDLTENMAPRIAQSKTDVIPPSPSSC